MRTRFGGSRLLSQLETASRHPCFGFSCLRLRGGDALAAQQLWAEVHETHQDWDRFAPMAAALPTDPSYFDHYRAVIAEAEETNFWQNPLLPDGEGSLAMKQGLAARLAEIIAEGE